MPFQPFNYGQAIGQAENILASQAARDPNSIKNQLYAAQLQTEMSGGDPTSNMRDMQYLQQMRASGKFSPQDIALMEEAISKRWYGDIGQVPSSARGGVSAPLSGASLQGEAEGVQTIKEAERTGTLNADLNLQPQIEYNKLMSQQNAQMGDPLGGGNTGLPAAPIRSAADIAGAQETAKVTANEEVKLKVEKARLGRAYKTFEVGISALTTALKNTYTGAFIGRVGAVTAAAQIADQAKAQMLPILKGIVRGAGEGVFTDADAQAVLALIPDRITEPDAIDPIIKNITDFIRSKLMLDDAPAAGGAGLSPAEQEELRQLQADQAAGKF